MNQFRDKMTNAMLEVIDGLEEEMERECLYCLEKLKQANVAGNISLPHENERGVRVVHGARLTINDISEYWHRRISSASSYVSREFADKHELYNKNVGIEN